MSVFLDTRTGGTAQIEERLDRWARFLKDQMEHIVYLEMHIFRGRAPPSIVNAINSRAPRLEILDIHLGEGVRNITRLLDNHAPHLRTIKIKADTRFVLSAFPSLRHLILTVQPVHFPGLLEGLKATPWLQTISVKGSPNSQPLPCILPERIALIECTAVTIKQMESHRIEYMLAHLRAPKLRALVVFETIVQLADHTFSTSLFSSLGHPNFPLSPTDSAILFGFFDNRFVVHLECYRLEMDWKDLVVRGGTSIMPLIHQAIIAPLTALELQPLCLTIHSTITAKEKNLRTPLSLVRQDLFRLSLQAFSSYTSVRFLEIKGHVNTILNPLLAQQNLLPNLLQVMILRDVGETISQSATDSLATLSNMRPVQILHHELVPRS